LAVASGVGRSGTAVAGAPTEEEGVALPLQAVAAAANATTAMDVRNWRKNPPSCSGDLAGADCRA
jgi:hypothetical protein